MSTNNLKKNVIANYFGQGWAVVMSLAFIPLYIKYLGMEAYGLIGVYSILQAWMVMLDMGITPTLNREVARYKAGARSSKSILDLLRSFELICVCVSLLIVASIWFAAPILSYEWLEVKSLPLDTVIQSIGIMGFVIAARLWEEVYRGVIRGMQEQVWLNGAQAILATLRWGGALLVIVWVSPDIQMFFLWQVFSSVISVLVYAHRAYSWLPKCATQGEFNISVLKEIKGFAGGMVLITLLALLLTQVDKLILSGLLPLGEFGYYVLAGVVAGGVSQLIVPMNTAVYPRFTELVTRQDKSGLVETYHNTCQLMSAIIIPPALVLAAFPSLVLLLWTGDEVLTASVAPILSLLVIGVLLNGFMNVPYMLQLAYGWTGFAIRVNIVAVVIIIPSILWAVPKYGAIGAAWVWVMLNVGYLVIGTHFMYRRLLADQKWRWYREAIVRPLLAGGMVTFGLAFLIPTPENRFHMVIMLVIVSVSVVSTVVLVLPKVRQRLFSNASIAWVFRR